ncbi:MAG: flavodoxin [Methanosphaera stadtmanae]|jgi:flavodoxin|nr:flavodoxin [Methanosphaera stadtmanae]
MKYAIRYYTKSGNTKKLADAIAEVLNIEAKPISDELEEDVGVLFLGSSIYGSAIDPSVKNFFNNLNVEIGLLVNFSTAGIMQSSYNQIKDICNNNDITISDDEFHCPGSFAGMNIDRPNEDDIENIKNFTRKFL